VRVRTRDHVCRVLCLRCVVLDYVLCGLFTVGCCFVIVEGACHAPVSLPSAECRRKRKRFLDQRKMAKKGAGSYSICCRFRACACPPVDLFAWSFL
jgi:hypothetical protein